LTINITHALTATSAKAVPGFPDGGHKPPLAFQSDVANQLCIHKVLRKVQLALEVIQDAVLCHSTRHLSTRTGTYPNHMKCQ